MDNDKRQKIKVFEMFAGYGGGSFALKKAGIDFDCVGYSEIDKFAIQCFNQNHPNIKNYGDSQKIDPYDLPDFDFLTAGFPCQSFSVAGNMKGENDKRGTLFNDIIRITEAKQPKYMLLENVKALTFKTFKSTFDKIISELERVGYNVYWKVLNSKNFGIPQNRERVYFVCIRKDINQSFEFPKPTTDGLSYDTEMSKKEIGQASRVYGCDGVVPPINTTWSPIILNTNKINQPKGFGLTLKDILLKDVPEKYYLNDSQLKTLSRKFGAKGQIFDPENDKSINTLTSSAGTGGGNVPCISNSHKREVGFKPISPTLLSSDYKMNKLVCLTPKEASLQDRVYHDNGIMSSLNSTYNSMIKNNNRIRKLTPIECFRLQGFINDEINLDNLSDSQKYKLAGNGWEINIVSLIVKQMFRS